MRKSKRINLSNNGGQIFGGIHSDGDGAMAVITALWAKVWPYIAIIAAALRLFLAFGRRGRRRGVPRLNRNSSERLQTPGRRPVKWMKNWIRWATVIFVIGLGSGCATTMGGSYCDIARPIRWQSQVELDATPTPVVRQIVGHNERWKAACGR